MQNPFSPNRIEYESRPILWFSQKSQRIARSGKPIFLAGTRGSGKTSILRSLSTHHILEDGNLFAQIGDKLNWYGVFFQLNETFSPLIDNATLALIPEQMVLDPQAVTNRQFVIFSHYLELKIVDRFLETLIGLRHADHLSYGASEERAIALDLQRDVFHFVNLPLRVEFFGFEELRQMIGRYIDNCYNAFFHGHDKARTLFFGTDPGNIILKTVSALRKVINGRNIANSKPFFFKILIDDCESLSPNQQQFLNTIIRKTRGDIKWVIAYIGGLYDTIRTVNPGQSLSNADRDVENIDTTSDLEFLKLCENVSSLRLYYALPEGRRAQLRKHAPLEAFDLKARLGNVSLNQIIDRVVENAQSEGRNRLIEYAEEAKEFLSLGIKRSQVRSFGLGLKARPYLEGLTLRMLPPEIKNKAFSDDGTQTLRRAIARKQGWAFLEACRMLKLQDRPYVGYKIIIQLSDGCIRDFLDIMGEVFASEVPDDGDSSGALFAFIDKATEIPMERQRRAVMLASKKKLDGLESLSQPFEEESVRMVRALGSLTRRLQLDGQGDDPVRTSERGLFRIDAGEVRNLAEKLGHPSAKIDEIFRRAEKDGFIRKVNSAGKFESERVGSASSEVTIRLHRRFAPFFGYSFRGPYEANTIPSARLVQLLFNPKDTSPEEWADAVFDQLNQFDDFASKQGQLFDGID